MPNKSGQLKEEDLIAPRRVRHITSIQVRNLTPFPVRDDSASALVLPSEQPQFSAHGHLADDLDVTLSKKRGRRRSSASMQSVFAHEAPDGSPIARDAPGRQRAMSKASIATSSSVGLSSTPRPRSSAVPPPSRPSHRTRTLSTASSVSQVSTGTAEHPVITPRSFPGLLKDTSQTALEKVLQSRLVETFLTISISPPDDVACDADPDSASLMRKDRQSTESVPQHTRRNTIVAAGSSGVPSLSTPPRRGTLSKLTSSSRASPSTAHSRAASTSAVSHGKPAPKPSAPQTLPRSAVSHPRAPSKAATSSVPRPTTPDLAGRKEEHPTIPDFFSSVHRPSTNPAFNIDAREHFDFVSNTDLSSARMTIEIWGRVVDSTVLGYKGKGKERAHDVEDMGLGHQGDEWKVLEHWNVNLNELIPMPDDLIYHPSRIPSNTLCVTLDPPGQTFYLLSARSALVAPPRSRSLSPSAGYNSDGESGVRTSAPTSTAVHFEAKPNGAPPRRLDPQISRRKGDKKSATWQDLVRLVDLQAVIKDTASSLSDVVREIDSLVTSNDTSVLTREASERDAWVTELRGEGDAVEGESRTLKQRLDAKREDLRRRRELLEAAWQAHEDDLQQEANAELVLRVERDRLAQLRRRLPVMRNSLITSLAFIYPIELLSPPDLLFTVLGVPLPIPNGPTDPAPPLSLPAHRDVNEDTAATALGYAAQVVQLLAAYLGIGLVYPVTCVGSRSLIKDGISAMVGPRMFPLFSKGVDTYRFEYAVFLLNKDIEMLMAERNLRALDMRHTLPNLKNLLLTLTDPDMVQTMPLRPPSVASATISALQSPVITPSTLTAEDEPPSLSSSEAGATDVSEHDGDSPPASGAATPTKAAEPTTPTGTVRKSRGFLDLAPLSGFFKARYPSSSRGASKTAEPPLDDEPVHAGDATPATASARHGEYSEAEGSDGEDVEDDRRTIRASTSEDDGDEEQKGRAKVQAGKGALTNGNGAAHHAPGEKLDVVDALRSPPVVEGVS